MEVLLITTFCQTQPLLPPLQQPVFTFSWCAHNWRNTSRTNFIKSSTITNTSLWSFMKQMYWQLTLVFVSFKGIITQYRESIVNAFSSILKIWTKNPFFLFSSLLFLKNYYSLYVQIHQLQLNQSWLDCCNYGIRRNWYQTFHKVRTTTRWCYCLNH